MKRIFLLVVAFIMFNTVHAQMDFGVKAGVNIANVTGDDIDADAKIGAYVGITYEYLINDVFSIQPEVVFSMQGAQDEGSEDLGGNRYSYESKLKLNYLNVPVLAKYYVMDNFFVVGGPQLGINVSAKAEDKESFDGESYEEEYDIDDVNVDFALALGLGYIFTDNIGAEVRYNVGLSDIHEDADIKNSVGQIGLFYRF